MTDAPPSPEGALEQYEAILSIDPEMSKARAGAGLHGYGCSQQAERDFIELLKTSPSDPYIAYPTSNDSSLAKKLHRRRCCL